MADIHEILRVEIAEAETALRRLAAERRRLHWQISYAKKLLLQAGEVAEQAATALPPDSPPAQMYRNDKGMWLTSAEKPIDVNAPYANRTAVEVVEDILGRAQEPMRIRDIAATAVRRGYVGRDGDPSKVVPNFSSMFSRAQNDANSPFQKVGRGTFALRKPEDQQPRLNGDPAVDGDANSADSDDY